MTEVRLHPYCNSCGWRKGGPDSWNGHACKCGHMAPPIRAVGMDALRDAAAAATITKSEGTAP